MLVETNYPGKFIDIDDRLLSNPWIERLKGIHQFDIYPFSKPAGGDINRFQHGIGVAYLTTLVDCTEQEHLLLKYAGLLHDVGLPCFGHKGEALMEEHLGEDHEARAVKIIENELKDDLNAIGINAKDITSTLNGEHYLSPLLVSDMDLDNIDNLYNITTPDNIIYHNPEKIAASFYVKDRKIYFKEESLGEIELWRKTRKDVYDLVFTTDHIIIEDLLMRALLANGNLGLLNMTNDEAIEALKENSESITYLDALSNRKYKAIHTEEHAEGTDAQELRQKYQIQYPNYNISIRKTSLDRDVKLLTEVGEIQSKKLIQNPVLAVIYEIMD